MKLNFLKQSLGVIAIATILSGCGGGSAEQNPNTSTNEAINLTDLPSGYQLNGYVQSGQKAGEEVKLIFCPDYRYSYYRGDENFNGDYEINTQRDEVVMKDDSDGGSYALEAKNGIFEVGVAYKCRDLRPITTGVVITDILPHSCPNNQ